MAVALRWVWIIRDLGMPGNQMSVPKPELMDSPLLFWGSSGAFSVLLCTARLGSSSLQQSPGIPGSFLFLIF